MLSESCSIHGTAENDSGTCQRRRAAEETLEIGAEMAVTGEAQIHRQAADVVFTLRQTLDGHGETELQPIPVQGGAALGAEHSCQMVG